MKLSDIKNNAIHVPNSTKSNEKLNIIIVNTENNGKRIKFSKSLLNELGNTNFIDIYIDYLTETDEEFEKSINDRMEMLKEQLVSNK